jgi:hypothetical protein
MGNPKLRDIQRLVTKTNVLRVTQRKDDKAKVSQDLRDIRLSLRTPART